MIGQLGGEDVSEPDARIDAVEAVDQGMLPIGLDRRITGAPSVNTEAASGRMTAIGATLPFHWRAHLGGGPPAHRQDRRDLRRTARIVRVRHASVQYDDQHGSPHAQRAALLRPVRARGHRRANPRQDTSAAPPPIAGRFMTTKPARSRCSTSRFATISAMILSALWTRLRPW